MRVVRLWAPSAIFLVGSILLLGVQGQRDMQLEGSLDEAIPRQVMGLQSQDLQLDSVEARIAGVDTYLLRTYAPDDVEVDNGGPAHSFSLYVGFYGSQAQGRTIHSPKNCMPGTGWEALSSREVVIETELGSAPVNRYILQRGREVALVLYWYQGRGRIQANEYLVKVDLLMDSAFHGRSDEALVRLVVPVVSSEEEAFGFARQVAAEIISAVDPVLPPL